MVLTSRSEMKRGEWKQFENADFQIRPMGSVVYKLALISAGLADATFTIVPKHEWDVAAGIALVQSSGGFVSKLDHTPLRFNQPHQLLSGLVAALSFPMQLPLKVTVRAVIRNFAERSMASDLLPVHRTDVLSAIIKFVCSKFFVILTTD